MASDYIPLLVLLVLATAFAGIAIVVPSLLGPKVPNKQKLEAYESGIIPFNDTRRRFPVKYYLVAMIFLIFDIEVIFLYPWAVAYTQLEPQSPMAGLFLARILFFIGTSVIAYIYAWRKGVFRWD